MTQVPLEVFMQAYAHTHSQNFILSVAYSKIEFNADSSLRVKSMSLVYT